MPILNQSICDLVDLLAKLPEVVAVVLGGSRALKLDDRISDWDIGVYYRGKIDLISLAAFGHIYPPGAWGRLMNGGAWIRFEGEEVDIILRDLDKVDYWSRCAEQGEFEIDQLLGYLAGVPTYLLTAELASCIVLRGTLPSVRFPQELALAAPLRWRLNRSYSLDYARVHAKRGNKVGATGQVAKAVMEEAHAILCSESRWMCNEKRLLEAAGLANINDLFSIIPSNPEDLIYWVDEIAGRLGSSDYQKDSLLNPHGYQI